MLGSLREEEEIDRVSIVYCSNHENVKYVILGIFLGMSFIRLDQAGRSPMATPSYLVRFPLFYFSFD